MSDIRNRLQSSRKEVPMTLSEVQDELARLRERCVRLEELVAVGTALVEAGKIRPFDYIPTDASAGSDDTARTLLGDDLLDLTSPNGAH